MKIKGQFTVKLNTKNTHNKDKALGRMSIDKQFHGLLSASSKGEMLSAMSPIKGSAGYVAIEKVTGSLYGKMGSFILQHYGIMNDKNHLLILEVVPNSGTGQLKGLSGSMNIEVKDSQHFYEFNYQLD